MVFMPNKSTPDYLLEKGNQCFRRAFDATTLRRLPVCGATGGKPSYGTTKRPPDRPTVLSLTVGVDALDFALAV